MERASFAHAQNAKINLTRDQVSRLKPRLVELQTQGAINSVDFSDLDRIRERRNEVAHDLQLLQWDEALRKSR